MTHADHQATSTSTDNAGWDARNYPAPPSAHPSVAAMAAPRRPSRDGLTRALLALILLAVAPLTVEAIVRMTHRPPRGGLVQHAIANIGGAHVTFTNPTSEARYECVVGVLQPRAGGGLERVESQMICSGPVKPYATVTVDAPFIGEPKDACADRSGDFSWDACTFELEPAEL